MTALPLALLRRDGGTQPRDHVNNEIAKEYAEAIADGAALPPVTLFYDGSDYWLADGFHRVLAHEHLERDTIEADVRQGDRRDAILFSVGANAVHGYRRSNADKRRAVVTLLNDPEWATWSDREIARRCNVGRDLVAAVRPKDITVGNDSEPTRIFLDRHGNTSVMKVGAIGKPAPKPLPEVAGRTPDHRPDPSFGKSDVIGINEASRVTGFEPRKLASIARSGEIEGAEKDSGSWQFETEKLRTWMRPTAEPTTNDVAPEPEPLTCPATGAPLLLAVADVFAQVATWPAAGGILAAWESDIGAGIPLDHIAKAAAWMVEFTTQYPSIEQRRQIAIAAALEGSAQHVA